MSKTYQFHWFHDGGCVIHAMWIGGRRYSGWFGPDGRITEYEMNVLDRNRRGSRVTMMDVERVGRDIIRIEKEKLNEGKA